MKRILLAVLFLMFGLVGVSTAQDLPVKPEPRHAQIKVKFERDGTKEKFTELVPVPHQTADKTFWTFMLVDQAAVIANVEILQRTCLAQPNCRINPVYGGFRPSRGTQYGVAEAIYGVVLYATWHYKRRDDAAKAFGAKIYGDDHYWLIPVAHIASNVIGAVTTIGARP